MRGRSIPISPGRRFVIDLMQLSRGVPIVSAQRRMQLGRIVDARARCAARPMWMTIFTKAHGMLNCEFPQLRRSYIKLPWPRLYEYPHPVAAVAVERDYRGEASIFPVKIKDPGRLPLAAIDRIIRDAKSPDGEDVTRSQYWLALNARLPFLIRRPLQWMVLNTGRQRANFFGTFAVAGMSELGVESQHIITPLSNCLSYGVIAKDGQADVRLYWDHRVMDGVVVGEALARMEHMLNETIADELLAQAT